MPSLSSLLFKLPYKCLSFINYYYIYCYQETFVFIYYRKYTNVSYLLFIVIYFYLLIYVLGELGKSEWKWTINWAINSFRYLYYLLSINNICFCGEICLSPHISPLPSQFSSNRYFFIGRKETGERRRSTEVLLHPHQDYQVFLILLL